MKSSDPKSTDRAKQILHRLAESSDSLEVSGTKSNPAQIAKRLEQIEQLFLLHGGERKNHQGPASDQILFEWGHLQVIGSLGEGSFGEVYRAYDRILDREVALKLLKDHHNRPFQSQLFLHEARQLALVRHRNVLAVHGAAIHDSRAGLWTDLIEGDRAHDDAHRELWSELEPALELIESMAHALQAVHAAGLIHSDIKPANIMCDQTGTRILMDFGASLDHRASDQAPNMTSGTPLYMAPEVVLGSAPSVESDLYSLGATLYRILLGQSPNTADDWHSLKIQHETGQAPASARSSGTLDRRIGELIDKLMSCSANHRPGLKDVLKSLQAIREAPQRRFRQFALSSIAGLLVLGLGFTSIGFYQANQARIEAETEQQNTLAVNQFLQRVLATPTTTGRIRDMTVEAMLRQGAEDITSSLANQPAARVVVHRVLAESFNTLRLPQLANGQISIARDVISAHNLSMPAIERDLDLTEIRSEEFSNRHEESIELAQRFVDQYLEALGEHHKDIRWAYLIQVTNSFSLGQYEQAEALMRQHFLEIPEPETASDHFGYELLKAWAILHGGQGRFKKAADSAERALDWLERFPNTRPVDRGGALTMVALSQARMNQPERAVEVFQELLPVHERMFGVASSEYIRSLTNLAGMQYQAGDVSGSGRTLESAREVIRDYPDAISSDHQLLVSMNLANVLNATGQSERAEALMRKMHEQAIALWDPAHQHVVTLEYNLAELLSQQTRFDEARIVAEQTLATKRDAFGDNHPLTLLTMDNLAVALAGLGQHDEALTLHNQALDALADQLGTEHPFALLVERHRMATLQQWSPEQVTPNRIAALVQRHVAELGPDHPDTQKARLLLGQSAK